MIQTPHHHRKDLGRPRGLPSSRALRRCSTSTCTWSTRSPRRRPSTAARARPQGAPPGPDPGHRRPQRPHHRPLAAHRRPDRRASRSRSWRRTAASSASPATASRSERQGIVHVIGPELGLTQPGMTIVCGDSHTATHGAFGALAFGIGTSEVEHVLATQCLLQRKPKTFQVRGGRRAAAGRLGQGHHPGADRQDRRRRRHRLRVRVQRRGHPRALDGRAHDRLQHVHRGAARAPA